MAKDLSFNNYNEDLSFNDYSDEEVSSVLSDIVSSLKFDPGNNPFLVELKASAKLLKVFQKRQKEIETSLNNPDLNKQTRADLRLELKMIKQALKYSA